MSQGKGSKRRPTHLSPEEWAARYDATFTPKPRCFLSLGLEGLAVEWEETRPEDDSDGGHDDPAPLSELPDGSPYLSAPKI